jgi:hypothetical protein
MDLSSLVRSFSTNKYFLHDKIIVIILILLNKSRKIILSIIRLNLLNFLQRIVLENFYVKKFIMDGIICGFSLNIKRDACLCKRIKA